MTITVSTVALIGLLTDALCTADPEDELSGIHLATYRDGYGDEPGIVDLLALTSTDRFVLGNLIGQVEGQMMPAVWPIPATQNVIAICKTLVKSRGKLHTVDIETVEMADDNDGDPVAPGRLVTLRETPELFPTDTEFQFHAWHETRFPLELARRLLTTDDTTEQNYRDNGVETIWTPRVLAAVTAVARHRKEVMQFYRSQNRRVQVVQIGAFWLGAVIPSAALPGEARTEPSIDAVLPPSAGAELVEQLASMKADGITVTVTPPPGQSLGPVTQALADAAGLVYDGTVYSDDDQGDQAGAP